MDPQLTTLLEQQLRDIHLPTQISWWPIAYGWWLLISLILCAIGTLIYQFRKKRKLNAYRSHAIQELNAAFANYKQTQRTTAYLQSANAVLKRAYLHSTGNHEAASKSGADWLHLLSLGAKTELSDKCVDALSWQLYRATANTDIEQIHSEIQHWLQTHQVLLTSVQDVLSEPITNSLLASSETTGGKNA